MATVKVSATLFWFAHYCGSDDVHPPPSAYLPLALLSQFPSLEFLLWLVFACLVGCFWFCHLAPNTSLSYCAFSSLRLARSGVGCIYLFTDLHHRSCCPSSISPELSQRGGEYVVPFHPPIKALLFQYITVCWPLNTRISSPFNPGVQPSQHNFYRGLGNVLSIQPFPPSHQESWTLLRASYSKL